MNPQAPAAVVMIRPHRFHPNPETAHDNGFQQAAAAGGPDADTLAREALAEVGRAAAQLGAAGVQVHLFDDDGTRGTPDSVFPNNWFSTHAGGELVLYPMAAPSRRRERRADVLDRLQTHYRVHRRIDLSHAEAEGRALEGTGAMVLDHLARVAYVARSGRADDGLLARFAAELRYEPLAFDTADAQGRPVYHTNVMMCVASGFALVGLGLIADAAQRRAVQARLHASGREVIELSPAQVAGFAGNAIELQGHDGLLLAMSARGVARLAPTQREAIERHARLLPIAVPTIERAGGSVRCMLAGVHLAPR